MVDNPVDVARRRVEDFLLASAIADQEGGMIA